MTMNDLLNRGMLFDMLLASMYQNPAAVSVTQKPTYVYSSLPFSMYSAKDNSSFRVEIACAGYDLKDLSIELDPKTWKLVVKFPDYNTSIDGFDILYCGIKSNASKFISPVPKYSVLTKENVAMKNGKLTILLHVNLPENLKSTKITFS